MTVDEMKIIEIKKKIRDCEDPAERERLEHCLKRKVKRFERRVRRVIRNSGQSTAKGGQA